MPQQQQLPTNAEEITFDFKKAAATVAKLKAKSPADLNINGNLAYYKERHARQVQPHLDSLLAVPESEWKDKTLVFDCYKLRQNSRTLQQRLHWAWYWLIVNDDPQGKYAHLRRNYGIHRRPGCVFFKHRYMEEITSAVIDADLVEQATAKIKLNPEGKRISQRMLIMEEIENFVVNAPEGESIVSQRPIKEQDLITIEEYMLPFLDTVAVVQLDVAGYRFIKNAALAKRLAEEKQ